MRRIFKYVIVDNLAVHPGASGISSKNNLLKKKRTESVVVWVIHEKRWMRLFWK